MVSDLEKARVSFEISRGELEKILALLQGEGATNLEVIHFLATPRFAKNEYVTETDFHTALIKAYAEHSGRAEDNKTVRHFATRLVNSIRRTGFIVPLQNSDQTPSHIKVFDELGANLILDSTDQKDFLNRFWSRVVFVEGKGYQGRFAWDKGNLFDHLDLLKTALQSCSRQIQELPDESEK